MSDDDKDTSEKQNGSNEPNQFDENEPGSSNRHEIYSPTNVILTVSDNLANIQQSESEILNFFANYGRSEGAFLPYIPTTEAFVFMQIPPDGGYAWIILMISFINGAIIDGIMFCPGRILPSLMDDLKISSGIAAFIISMQIGLYFAIGPIASILVNKIGFRYVTMLGTIVSMFGSLIGSFSTDILYLFLFYGAVVGIGHGIAILATQMIVNFYFEKYRAIACGICSASSGLGVFLSSPMYHFFVVKTGWRNTLRIQSLISCLMIFSSIFYQPVKLTKIGKYVEQPLKEEETLESMNSIEIAYDRYSKFLSSQTDKDLSIILSTNQFSSKITNTKDIGIKKLRWNKFCCGVTSVDTEKETVVEDKKFGNVPSNVQKKVIIEVAPLDREDIFYEGNPNYEKTANKLDDENITVLPGKEKQAIAINYTISVARNLATDHPDPSVARKIFPHCTLSAKLMHTLHILFDTKVFNSKEFLIFFISQLFFYMGANIPYIFLTAHTEIPPQYANLLLSLIGLLNIIVRIFGGVLAYSIEIDPLYFSGVSVIICGIFTFTVGYIGKDLIWFQFLYCCIFSTANAFSVSFRSIIIVDLLGLDKLTNAFGFNSLGLGIGTFIGTNAAGLIVTYTGKADLAFGFAGITIFISGVLVVSLHLIVKFCCSKEPNINEAKKVKFSSINTTK